MRQPTSPYRHQFANGHSTGRDLARDITPATVAEIADGLTAGVLQELDPREALAAIAALQSALAAKTWELQDRMDSGLSLTGPRY